MNTTAYKEIIAKTAVYPKQVDNFGLAYAWLGLIDETEEFYEVPIDEVKRLKKEFGDAIWYICAVCNEAGASFEKVISAYLAMVISTPAPTVNNYTGTIKKYYRDNTPLNVNELEIVLAGHLFDMYFWAYDMTEIHPEMQVVDLKELLPEVLDMNYQKLIARRETNTLHGSGDNREER